MINGGKDEPVKPALEELLKYSKIVTVHKECTCPKLDNLKKILEAVDGTKFQNDIPVAMVAAIGPKGSGKSFITNFLIQYMKQEGEGGWMSSLVSQNGFAEGFSFGSISSEKFYEPDSKKGAFSGIYLWPEPFLMTKTGGGKLVVWIMHVHSVQDDSQENLAALERFLMLTCSRIMEVKWKNDEEFRILQHSQFLSDYDSSLQKQICDSVVYTFRSRKKISADTDEEAIETLRELLQEVRKGETAPLNSLNNCKHVNITWMNDIPEPLHDGNGAFSAKMKNVHKPIRVIVDKMLEESEIDQKSGGEHQLTLGNMIQFIETAANKILASGPLTSQNPDEKPAYDENNCRVANPTYSKPMENIATCSSNLSNGSGTTPPVPQEDQNDESSKMDKSEIINDEKISTTTTLGNLHPPTKTRETRALFFAEMMGPTATNAKVEVGNDTFLLSADKEEGFRNVGVNKDQNQNSTKIVKQEIPQSSDAASIPPATPKPDYSDQKLERMNNLNSQMEVDQSNRHDVLGGSAVPDPEENGRNSTEPMDVDDDVMVEKAVQQLQNGESSKSDLKKKQQEGEMAAQRLARERRREEATKKQQEENRKKEQERQRKEEQNKRQDEEARSVMMECFHIAVSQIQRTFPSSITMWINEHLNFSTLNQIETIYAHAFYGTIEEHRQAVNAKLWNEFVSRVDNHCKEECISVLKIISESVLQLNRAVKKQFDFHGYFNAPKFEKMFKEESIKLKNPQDDIISVMIKLATDKLQIIYQKHNELILDEERNNFKIVSNQIENLYHEQMKRYMQFAPYSPQKLQNIHKKLTEKLVDAFKKAFYLSSAVNSFITTLEGPLKEALAKGYKSYETSNDTKLEKSQSEINKILSKSKMKYTEDIEAILKQYPDGVEMRVLTKQNDIIRTEAMKLLEMEIRPKREDEPVEIHQEVLQSHIDNYWPAVLKANHKNLERKKKRDEEEQRKLKKVEAQRKLQQNGATEIQKSATLSTTVTVTPQPQHQQNISSQKNMSPQVNGEPPLLTPLVFHLQSSRIVMAMEINGHPTILENELGEMQTPAWVALNSENKFVYGSDALALVHQDETDQETDILCWSVADFFINGSLLLSTQVCINGTDHEITPEFFLAVLLSNLKETTEHKMGCQCMTAVIAIPFSFSSLQRIRVKDAAKIAGFSEVYLVNEASAAAYNFVLRDMHPNAAAEVLVLSENIDRVDAFVYSYDAFDKKLKMLGHAGNYQDDTDRKQAWSFRKFAKGAIKSFLNYVFSNDMDSSNHNDYTTRTVRDACKSAISDASFRRSKIELNEVLFICESFNRWSVVLSNVAKDFGRKACDINQENAVVSGAVILGRNPKEIGRFVRDKLAYDVERLTQYSGCRVVSSRKELLPENSKKQNVTLPNCLTLTSFHQDVLGVYHDIGKLAINSRMNCDQYIEPSLDITNEGIVKFKSVTMHSNRQNLKSRVIYYVPEESINWTTPNLSDEALTILTSLLASVTVPKVDPALVQAKTSVLEKCKEMEDKIADDKFKMRSDLAKEMVAKNIAEAKQFASHEKASIDDINKQMDTLQRLCDKYEKK